LVQSPSQQTGLPRGITFLFSRAAMFSLLRMMKFGYVVALAMLALVLAWTGTSDAQGYRSAPQTPGAER
jgi:hypothetical protein